MSMPSAAPGPNPLTCRQSGFVEIFRAGSSSIDEVPPQQGLDSSAGRAVYAVRDKVCRRSGMTAARTMNAVLPNATPGRAFACEGVDAELHVRVVAKSRGARSVARAHPSPLAVYDDSPRHCEEHVFRGGES